MSRTQAISTEDPEYYAELFHKTRRPINQRPLLNERLCPYVQNVDDPLTERLQLLLDTAADISLCKRGNVSATAACLRDDNGTLDIQLYIVFDHADSAARLSAQHLQHIFNMLRQVPYKASAADGSSKIITNDLQDELIEICKVIHNYSFTIFVYRVNKRKHMLSVVQGHIEQDQTYFTPQERSTLLEFLDYVDLIIDFVADAQHDGEVSTIFMRRLIAIYHFCMKRDLLPKDSPAGNQLTLLNKADKWLAEKHSIGFQLQRWILKIMSFVISANRLFLLTQSHRFRKLTQGKFSVQVLTSPITAPYRCNLSPEIVQETLDVALAEAGYRADNWAEARESFIEPFPKEQDGFWVERQNPTVHAELAIIMAMVKGEIQDVFPYIGVSKLSCIMCSCYIRVFNEVTQQKIVTRGSHRKAYPGWFWPSLPDHDGELRVAFSKQSRRQLVSDFHDHAGRRLSDNSMGSGRPEVENNENDDDAKELLSILEEKKARRAHGHRC